MKPADRPGWPPRLGRFHRRKAVAPLKLWGIVWVTTNKDGFPSPKGGGPIEATGRSWPCPTLGRFPSPKGGGPIEAGCEGRLLQALVVGFHRRKAVAPLKPIDCAISHAPHAGFHRRKAVAPLKLLGLKEICIREVAFPSPKGGGPIEATVKNTGRKPTSPVSIAERRWPH